jgi:hypothetical protein
MRAEGHPPKRARGLESRPRVILDPDEHAGFAGVMTAGLETLRDHGLRVDPQLTLAIKALTQAESFTRALYGRGRGPDESRQGIAAFVQPAVRITNELIQQTLTPAALKKTTERQLGIAGRELAANLPITKDTIGTWLEQLRTAPAATIPTAKASVPTPKAEPTSNAALIAIAVILAGIVIGSALAATTSDPDTSFVTLARAIFPNRVHPRSDHPSAACAPPQAPVSLPSASR